MESLIKIAMANPEYTTLIGMMVIAAFTFAGKWWGSYFSFRADTANVASNAAEAAIRMQTDVLKEVRVELRLSEERLASSLKTQKEDFDKRIDRMKASEKEALEAQAKHFNDRIDRMRETENKQQAEIKALTKRLTEHESKDKEYKREIAEWKEKYWELNNAHLKAKAKLSVYEKETENS